MLFNIPPSLNPMISERVIVSVKVILRNFIIVSNREIDSENDFIVFLLIVSDNDKDSPKVDRVDFFVSMSDKDIVSDRILESDTNKSSESEMDSLIVFIAFFDIKSDKETVSVRASNIMFLIKLSNNDVDSESKIDIEKIFESAKETDSFIVNIGFLVNTSEIPIDSIKLSFVISLIKLSTNSRDSNLTAVIFFVMESANDIASESIFACTVEILSAREIDSETTFPTVNKYESTREIDSESDLVVAQEVKTLSPSERGSVILFCIVNSLLSESEIESEITFCGESNLESLKEKDSSLSIVVEKVFVSERLRLSLKFFLNSA